MTRAPGREEPLGGIRFFLVITLICLSLWIADWVLEALWWIFRKWTGRG